MTVGGTEQGVLPERRAAEEQCRARVYAAKLRFELAVAQVDEATRSGAAGAVLAHRIEQEARQHYQHELENFANLIVHGELAGDNAA
jgi:hypothetical protein